MLTYCELELDESVNVGAGQYEPGWLLHAQVAWVQGWECGNRIFANHEAGW